MVRLFVAISLALWLTASLLAAPLSAVLPATSLDEALGSFDSIAFHATARWQSNHPQSAKMRLADGATNRSGESIDGGHALQWDSASSHAFTLNFNGERVSFRIDDGVQSYVLEIQPRDVAMNGLLLALRSEAGRRIQSEIALTHLTLNGSPVAGSTMALSGALTQSYLLIRGVGTPFTLTGNLRIAKTGGSRELPSLVLYAGMADPLIIEAAPAAAEPVPESRALIPLALGVLVLVASHLRSHYARKS